MSCRLRLKAGFVKGPDNAQKKEIVRLSLLLRLLRWWIALLLLPLQQRVLLYLPLVVCSISCLVLVFASFLSFWRELACMQFGVVLSGGPLVLSVHGEESELLCGAFFQVAPHEVWSLRNDQE